MTVVMTSTKNVSDGPGAARAFDLVAIESMGAV